MQENVSHEGKKTPSGSFNSAMILEASKDAFKKLNPSIMWRNPVMFVVEIVAVLSIYFVLRDLFIHAETLSFNAQIAVWLWITVLFANFSEAIAEGRGKAQASALRKTRSETLAKKLDGEKHVNVPAPDLRKGDIVLVEAGDVIPGDGEVIEGIASVDESAVTGESAPVIRESGGDRSSVTGGTKVLSDWIKVKITANPGETFLDRMIHLVEGAKRQKTPNEIALTILLLGLTIIFLLAVATLEPYAIYSGTIVAVPVLAALLVCLIPTTIGGLLSAIGIAGMDRLLKRNVLAMSGRAVEAAGDVNVLLLDKTGTITLGNRMATEFIPAPDVPVEKLADAAQISSLADETPEGRSIVILAKEKYNLRERDINSLGATFIPFSAQTRMSGVNFEGREIRKGATDAIENYVREQGGIMHPDVIAAVEEIAKKGGTPLVVAEGTQALGVIYLKDVVKGGIKERFAQLRKMGIKTVMITGDNPLTAAAIAAEAGVDDFLAEATPEAKLKLIRDYQNKGHLVAMTGDGTNDAPALAQADVGVAMNSGTQAAKEAGNMVDLDSNPTKLIEVVEIGKQLLMTRGSLTTFSIANDVAKYFAIIPALFFATYPQLKILNIMHLATPQSAILSAVIFNALIIIALVPLALRGVKYEPLGANIILRKNLLFYGLGGLIVPFIGIKIIDLIISALGWA
ncbi:K+-transporting ATPase, B subunit [Desulfosporosinus acidiphilus SJ4]|uniref:Potassium-transporting ATPase ATP-binding subunit n=1 Tax=Desulfosporosinus acidiphilus (strain DSM 22704 / JCM 16185 / SJ4) TaxID=646529 RepID=I4D2C6_DESAJ|nr:potassium-transporting ATPase subunit KdpB [Desulfosporosinus acidiphilus]AFM39950.1 K+-transporting ATPase, B subunit [Desulfosporosinus acidiphilus SJ4]